MSWICEDCGWDWPLDGEEPWAWAECDNCGNSEFVEEVEEFVEEPLFAAPHTCSLPVDRPALTSGTRWTCVCGAVYVFVDSWKDRQRVRQWMPTRCPHCQATNVLEPRPPHCSHDWHTWTAA